MKRLFDLIISVILLALLAPLMAVLAMGIKLTSRGPIIYWSLRVGRDGNLFSMPKFRTMRVNTPVVATHLLNEPMKYLTPLGQFLRRSSLDELPQLWSVLIGDMSFVGPRPALFNQKDLIALRVKYGVDKLIPGLTGWAQVNGRDELSVSDKVKYEIDYLNKQSIGFDFKIMGLTFLNVMQGLGITH